jgi:carbonic anhydrase
LTVKLGQIQSTVMAQVLANKDQAHSVVDDVRRIREHPLVAKHIPIYGYIYDVLTGSLDEVAEATEAGRPR